LKFCPTCGAATERGIPADDDRERDICSACATIHYHNPKVIVGCIPEHNGRILMCKRAIEPRYGFWTLPAGFMENGETTAEGAARETWEEAAAIAEQPELYRIFDVPHISQVYIFYRCGVVDGRYGVGPESLETDLVLPEDIPWDNLAFPVVRELLTEFIEDSQNGQFPIRHSVISFGRK
jgi:ADP-ribose pyrophosphatase YjhB (NUDIX family)